MNSGFQFSRINPVPIPADDPRHLPANQVSAEDRQLAMAEAARQMLEIWGYGPQGTRRGLGGTPHKLESVSSQYCSSCGARLTNSGEAASRPLNFIKSAWSSGRLMSVRLITAVIATLKASKSKVLSETGGRDVIAPHNTESGAPGKGPAE
jgi:hypothetical protein